MQAICCRWRSGCEEFPLAESPVFSVLSYYLCYNGSQNLVAIGETHGTITVY